MTTEERNRYFQELTLNLKQEGFTTGQTEEELLSVTLDSRRLCLAAENGGVRCWKEGVASEDQQEALSKVIDIAKVTTEYMSQMELAPQLAAGSLKGDYQLLSNFNDTVLAGHPTKYGMQFITWNLTYDRTSLDHGRYHGPGVGVNSYITAKQDFATRSGLIPSSALFTPEQLAELYRCIDETLENICPLTDEQVHLLESASKQMERIVPDLEERALLSMHKEEELDLMLSQQEDGMQFC